MSALLVPACSSVKVNEISVGGVQSKDTVVYLQLIRFPAPQSTEIVNSLMVDHGWIGVKLLSVETSQRSFTVDRIPEIVNEENQIIEAMTSVGIEPSDVRVEIYDNQITVEKLRPF